MESIGNYSNGKKEGLWKEYYESGELEGSGKYAKELMVGQCKGYYKSGKLKHIIDHYENSRSYIEYYENGNKSSESVMRTKDKKYGSKLDDPFKQYYGNGNLKIVANFDYGTQDGIYKSYDESGNLEQEFDYDLVKGTKYLLESDGKNHKKALELLLKSAKRGNKQAEFNIGIMYHEGIGVSVNYDITKEWYYKSCNKNFYNACVNIGSLILSKEEAIINEMNSLGSTESDNNRYDILQNQRLNIYKEALPFMEKAYYGDNTIEGLKNK